ncbi:MAG: hypothetical protein IJ356_08005 [Erysipelotrichaceae bacterium]|nr:hypothetical protein [Erysipelotrichaceae bacterium]
MKKYNDNTQVFTSENGGLILKENGDLYACGSNSERRFGINDEFIPYNHPKLILKDVKHAALSFSNMLYIDQYDKVHIVGDNEYAKYFTGFKNAEKVYALGYIFLIKAKDGKFYGFGKNAPFSKEYKYWSGVFQSTVEIPVCDPVTVQAKIHPAFESLISFNNKHIQKYEESIFETETFAMIRKQYPNKHLFPKLLITSEELVSTENPSDQNSSDCVQTYHITYQPIIWYMDHDIYTPVIYTKDDYRESFYYAGCMFASSNEPEFSSFNYIKKASSVQLTNFMLLTDNTLHVVTGKQKSMFYMNDVADVSAFGSVILISKTDGQVLYGVDQTAKLIKKSLFKTQVNYQLEECHID